MRVITIQNEEVLKELEEKGRYIVDKEKSNYKNYKKSYDFISKILYDKYKVDMLPIWGFIKIHNEEPKIDLNWSFYQCEFKEKENPILLELEIDEQDGLLTNYYNWTDIMYYIEEGDDLLIEVIKDNLYDLEGTIQVCIPILYPEMIKGVYR